MGGLRLGEAFCQSRLKQSMQRRPTLQQQNFASICYIMLLLYYLHMFELEDSNLPIIKAFIFSLLPYLTTWFQSDSVSVDF